MWFVHGPGGIPIVLAVGKEPPPSGQNVIDGFSWNEAINAGVLQPDNTYGQRALVAAYKWFRSLG